MIVDRPVREVMHLPLSNQFAAVCRDCDWLERHDQHLEAQRALAGHQCTRLSGESS